VTRKAVPGLGRTEGWVGMFTAAADVPARPGYAHLCVNCCPAWPGGPIRSRPGIAAMGTGAGNVVYAIFSFYTAASVLVTGRLVKDGALGAAHLDTYNWGTGVWTTVLTAAQIYAALAFDVGSAAKVDWVPFKGTIVFSDGQNVPWTWDGTAGAGIVKLTNAPVAYGKPTVHYAKLFFIKNAERNTIVWSEENQPNVGYEAGGYNNAWTLTQTGGAPLVALLGTNACLYYWRSKSTGKILGAVTPDFQNAGVHDSVSTAVGCGDFRSVTRYGTETWWMDDNGGFQVLPDGGLLEDVTPLALRSSQVATVDPFGFETLGWVRPQPSGVFGPIECLASAFTQGPGTGPGADRGRVWFSLQGGTSREWVGVIVFDAPTRKAQGYFTFPTVLSQMATLTGPSAGEVLAFSTPQTAPSGGNKLWLYGLGAQGAAAGGADAGPAAGTTAIACTFVDGPARLVPEVESAFTRVDLTAFVDCAQVTPAVVFNLRWVSSEYPSATVTPAAQAQQIPAAGTVAVYTEQHLAYGVATVGRWFRPVVQWNMGAGNEAFGSGIKALSVDATPLARPPALV
jgi:hypothetical protein